MVTMWATDMRLGLILIVFASIVALAILFVAFWKYPTPLFLSIESAKQVVLQNIVVILGIITILIPVVAFAYNRNRSIQMLYEVVWKNPQKLKPTEILGLRGSSKYGFDPYYHSRKTDDLIRERIMTNANVLVVGNPLAGKSRAVYECLRTLDDRYSVVIPKLVSISPKDFRIPINLLFWRKKVLVIDDLEIFSNRQNFPFLLREFLERNIIIVASCRSGPEYDRLCRTMPNLHSIFGDPVMISRVPKEEAYMVAKKTGRKLHSTFDGNIGSIFIQLDAMRARFKNCNENEKGVLRVIKRLCNARLYIERDMFSVEDIKKVCKDKEEIELRQFEWTQLLDDLKNKGFIEVYMNRIRAESAYIEFVIESSFNLIDNLKDMMRIFSGNMVALNQIGLHAQKLGDTCLEKRESGEAEKAFNLSVEAYTAALSLCHVGKNPSRYIALKSNIASAYLSLSRVKEQASNCKKAIQEIKDALKVKTLEKTFLQPTLLFHLGLAYMRLSEVENKASNSRIAIKAFKDALKTLTVDEWARMIRVQILRHTGLSYMALAEVENRGQNCIKATDYFVEVLNQLSPETDPINFVQGVGDFLLSLDVVMTLENWSDVDRKRFVDVRKSYSELQKSIQDARAKS